MLIIDANAILRYLLNDNSDMAKIVEGLVNKNKVIVRYEIVAEVVYVLEKVYMLPRNDIKYAINTFLAMPNVETETTGVLLLALNVYADKKIDFVDCLLYGFNVICGHDIFTFDKKLTSLINSI